MEKKKLLLIDDDVRLKTLLVLTIGGHYVFLQAGNGEEGIRLARDEKPDLVLLDVAMPVMDGFEVLRRLKDDGATRETPVLMLTGRDSPDDIRRARELGAGDYFTKPFSPIALLDKLNEILK